jgi:hypothetical protein
MGRRSLNLCERIQAEIELMAKVDGARAQSNRYVTQVGDKYLLTHLAHRKAGKILKDGLSRLVLHST